MSHVCSICKGRKNLCGRSKCLILQKFRISKKFKGLIEKKEFFGASPPSLFVGEYGYPKVRIGPMLPTFGDVEQANELLNETVNETVGKNTEFDIGKLENPKNWTNSSIDEIMHYRSMLVMGETKSNVKVENNYRDANLPTSTRYIENIQEIAMSIKPVDSEMKLLKNPKMVLGMNSYTSPMGAKENLLKFDIAENPKIPKKTDSVVNDEMKSLEGVMSLYNSGFDEYYIIKLLSTGLMGVDKRIVPTKWSITAVQDMIGKEIRKEVIGYNVVNNYELYHANLLGNRYFILLMPDLYAFEAMEVWLKGSLYGKVAEYHVLGDYEGIKGLKGYVKETAGAFHASRLSVMEHLQKRKKQAKIVVIREITPDYYAPVGVWQIRQGVKLAMDSKKIGEFDNLKSAISGLEQHLVVPVEKYVEKSKILKITNRQTLLEQYF
ncbi:hypothetical protein M2325_000524 [Methanococcus voltae PS]|uniref:DNA repair protein n=1 Tax=Methanococcus voltae PS TaxID=523842 RepID=A0ABT2EWR1_METVO|nr:hypothetical protein [Methanococcus voltae PS]